MCSPPSLQCVHLLNRSTRQGNRVWVSCKQPGQRTEDCSLVKSADGQLKEEENTNFVVTNQTSVSGQSEYTVVCMHYSGLPF